MYIYIYIYIYTRSYRTRLFKTAPCFLNTRIYFRSFPLCSCFETSVCCFQLKLFPTFLTLDFTIKRNL